MGRSRRERREAQAQRAVESNDLGALASLAKKSPEIAAQKLVGLAAGLPPSLGPLDALALSLAATLRDRRHAAAGKVASAFAHRSTAHRLEWALCAFSSGDDDAAEQAAGADPAVARAMG